MRGLRAVLLGLLLGVALTQAGVSLMRIEGHSMDPTLFHGEIVLVIRPQLLALGRALGVDGWSQEQRGAVVVTPDPRSEGRLLGMGRQLIVKRVVGLSSETVTFRVGQLLLNGEPVDEPWVAADYRGALNMPARQVPEDAVFLVGDNRRPLASNDSRQYGPLPAAGLRGRIMAQVRLPWGEEGLRSPLVVIR